MKTLLAMIRRNVTLFFKDKGVFFTSLITPLILLVLYATFLGNIYRDSFVSGIPQELNVPDKLINGLVGGQLISSILAVSCVTVAFCSNMIMVQDKATGIRKDLTVSPVSEPILAVSYYVATFLTTVIVCVAATALCLVYIASIGWYMTFGDVMMLLADVLLLTMFGTALSSIINHFLSTQGQISAVGTIVSSGYGFICGAYMPISQFSEGLQKVLAFLPGTYGTSLIRNASMRGALSALEEQGVPEEVVSVLRGVVDCDIYFFDNKVTTPAMYAVLIGTVALLIAVYVLISAHFFRKRSV